MSRIWKCHKSHVFGANFLGGKIGWCLLLRLLRLCVTLTWWDKVRKHLTMFKIEKWKMKVVWLNMPIALVILESFGNWDHPSPCNICDYASSYKNHLRQHIKRTVQKIQTNATNTTIPLLRHRVWRIIWKCTVEKSQTSATYATLHPLIKAIWGNLGKRTVEKSKTNATNVTMDTLIMAIWGNIQKMHSRERSNATNATMPLLR